MKVKTKELRELSSDELVTRRRDLKHEMLNLRVQQQSGQLENPARIFTVRREVARIETILSQRRLQIQGAEGSAGAPAVSRDAGAAVAAPKAKQAPARRKAAAKSATKSAAPAKSAATKADVKKSPARKSAKKADGGAK